jgi:hypothetical protein
MARKRVGAEASAAAALQRGSAFEREVRALWARWASEEPMDASDMLDELQLIMERHK